MLVDRIKHDIDDPLLVSKTAPNSAAWIYMQCLFEKDQFSSDQTETAKLYGDENYEWTSRVTTRESQRLTRINRF